MRERTGLNAFRNLIGELMKIRTRIRANEILAEPGSDKLLWL